MQLAMTKYMVSLAAAAGLARASGWTVMDINYGQWSEVVERDVCVVGGGASGVHAAVGLVDAGKTVAVVERNDFLGGHTHTYVDPDTQVPVDIGVIVYQPIPDVLDFFAKFDVPLVNLSTVHSNAVGQPANLSVPAALYNSARRNMDFRNGSATTLDWPDAQAQADALQQLAGILVDYAYLLQGYDLPDPVPEDLYLPFGAFLEKYNITAAFPVYYQYSEGMGDLLHISTIYVIKYFNLEDLQYSASGYLTQAQGDNSLLYTRAGEFLGADNVFLESVVVSANRQANATTTGRPELLISTRGEGLKLLSCGQVLLSIPPTLTNLRGWDLTAAERAVFAQYATANGYWTGLVRGAGLNQSESVYNAAQSTVMNIPVLPALYYVKPTGVLDDVWYVKFSADDPTLTDGLVQSYIERQISTVQEASGVNVTENPVEWLIFESHTPFHLQVAPEAIKDGFYAQLTALQGGLDETMFYTGAAFHTQASTALWRFNNDVVIPKILGQA